MSPVLAYIGPAAGIAFAGSFLNLIVGFFLTVGALAARPLRAAWAILRGRRGYRNVKVQRLIFLGLDGLDPRLMKRFMAEGKLPNMSRLKQQRTRARQLAADIAGRYRRKTSVGRCSLHTEESRIRIPGMAWVEVDYPKTESWFIWFLAISTASALVFNRYA